MDTMKQVLALCPFANRTLFSTEEKFREQLLAVCEAWLEFDRWVPTFGYVARGPGDQIYGSMLMSRTLPSNVDELRPIIERGGNYVALLGPSTRFREGERKPNLPNCFRLTMYSKPTLNFWTHSWEVRMKGDGSVISWARERQFAEVVPLSMTPSEVFSLVGQS